MNDVSGVLERAADLLSKPGAWIQGYSALDEQGLLRTPIDVRAVCWCASGAICRAGRDKHAGIVDDAHKVVRRLLRGKIWTWNDRSNRTQAEVVAKLREAALLAQSPNIAGGGE